MSWSYGQNPSGNSKDAVRFLVGQTSTADPVLVQDEEITFALAETANNYAAAVLVGEAMLNRLAGMEAESLSVGNLSESYGDRSAKLNLALQALRRQAGMRGIVPVAGGVLLADKLARQRDTSLTPHAFSLGMDDNPPGNADMISSGASWQSQQP